MSFIQSFLAPILQDKSNVLYIMAGVGLALFYGVQQLVSMPAKQLAQLQPWLWGFGAVAIVAGVGVGVMAYRRNLAEAERRKAINESVANGPTMLVLPRSSSGKVDPESAQLWDRAVSVLPNGEHMAWEVSGNADSHQISIHASANAMPAVLSQVMTEWPDCEQRQAGPKHQFHDPVEQDGSNCVWIEVGPMSNSTAIKSATSDPLQSILTELSQWPTDCVGVVQVLMRPDQATAAALKAQATQTRNAASMRVPGQPVASGSRMESNRTAKELETRSERTFLEVIIRVAAHAPDAQQAQARAMNLVTAIRGAYDVRSPIGPVGQPQQGDKAVVERLWLSRGRAWNAGELATLAHLPGRNVVENFPRLQVAAAQYRPAAPALRVKPGTRIAPVISKLYPVPPQLSDPNGKDARLLFGTSTDKAGNTYFCGVPPRDWTAHSFAVGSTGSGKSTLLKNMVVQAYGLGMTAMVIDPHGKLAEDTALAMPDSRFSDVVFLDLSSKCPPALPLFASGLRYGLDDAVQGALDVFKTADPQNWDVSAQMQEILSSSVRTLMVVDGANANIPKLERMYTQGVFRDQLVSRAKRFRDARRAAEFWETRVGPALDPEAKRGSGGDSLKQSLVSAQRRFSLLLNHSLLRRTLALHAIGPKIDIPELIDSGKMILVPVRKEGPDGLGGKAWGVSLTLLTMLTYQAGLGRDYSDPSLGYAMVMLDEFASMGNLPLVDYIHKWMAELRKFRMGLFLGTQSLELLPRDTADQIRTNTNNKFILRCANEDEAKAALRVLADKTLDVNSILSMPKYSGYCANLVNDGVTPPALVKMLDEVVLGDLPPRGQKQDAIRPFRPSKEFIELMRKVPPMARTNPKQVDTAGDVVDFLAGLSDNAFNRVVDDTQSLGQYLATWMLMDWQGMARFLADDTEKTHNLRVYANAMLEHPKALADKGNRVRMVSGGLYGLPWWLREAAYVRETAGIPMQAETTSEVELSEADV